MTVRSGKGDKDRTTYLDEGAMAALSDWLALRGDHPGALFHPTVKGGRISPRRMSDQAVLDILRQRGEQAQVSAFSPQDFRRTFISNLLDAGVDISTVQKLGGHASPGTIAQYYRRGEDVERKAAKLLAVTHAVLLPDLTLAV